MDSITNKLRKITITTAHGDTFDVTDTEECRIASLALAQFKRGGIMNFQVDGADYCVPASAVDSIKVEDADSEEIVPDEG